jgi:putative cell wall-binding protein
MNVSNIRAADLAQPLLVVLGVIALVLALLPATAAAQQEQDDGVSPARIDGETRFHTAANIATTTFDSADVAVLATGQDYPDALAASFAAGSVEGPVLLVTRDGVPAPTWTALEALDVDAVVLIGGDAAISAAVEEELGDAGYETDRIEGVNRFQTASAVAMRYGTEQGIGTVEGQRTAILASGESFPDALSAGPLAAAASLPLLLTPRDTTEFSVNTSLEQLDIERIIVVGGQAAVSSDVVEFYQERYEVERFAGPDRNATAATVATNAIQRFADFSAAGILLARGDDYPDALSASIHGAQIGAPILLTSNPTVLSPATEGWLTDACPAVDFIRALGGTSAVSTQALDEAVKAAEDCLDEPAQPIEWTMCHNPDQGYTVDYPVNWATNAEERGRLGPCSVFDPDPEELEWDHMEIPETIAVAMRVDAVTFDREDDEERFSEELSREETTVDGRRAMRVELRATGEGRRTEGTLTTQWRVRLGAEQTFIASSHSTGEPTYEHKVNVLDHMMATIDYDEPADEPTTEPIAEPSTAERDSGDMPRDNEPAYLVDVRTGVHENLDRVVMEFTGTERPGWQVSWEDEVQDPRTGEPMDIRGEAFLVVDFHFAGSGDPETGEVTYTGPERIAVDGQAVTEVVFVHDDAHGLMTWAIGLDQEDVPFATAFLHDPLRFVLDVVPQ